MKLKNALKKIIHSVCLISVLFLSVFFFLPPVESFADTYNCSISVQCYGYKNSSGVIYYSVDDTTYTEVYSVSGFGSQSNNVPFNLTVPGYYRFYAFSLSGSDRYYIRSVKFNNSTTFNYNSSKVVYEVTVDDGFSVLLDGYNYSSSALNNPYIYVHVLPSSTPTPDPSTPTPDPSTPTPGPATPTPTVSTPTPDANAEAFFGKLGSDAQNGVGAIMTAWTAANSHFYTSVLFIVLPVFLGIVGLIASFFFGGGDDD